MQTIYQVFGRMSSNRAISTAPAGTPALACSIHVNDKYLDFDAADAMVLVRHQYDMLDKGRCFHQVRLAAASKVIVLSGIIASWHAEAQAGIDKATGSV
jgi:hypothetical protein